MWAIYLAFSLYRITLNVRNSSLSKQRILSSTAFISNPEHTTERPEQTVQTEIRRHGPHSLSFSHSATKSLDTSSGSQIVMFIILYKFI